MTVPVLLTGLLIAMAVFAALGWSAARIFQTRGRARWVHGANGALILAGMALISAEWEAPARALGALLIAAALLAAGTERGAARLLPLLGAGFGAALLLGLPFAGR